MNRRHFLTGAATLPLTAAQRGTRVEIRGDQFFVDGKPTYAGRTWKGRKIEGLLMNSRMVQGIFDDANPATAGKWVYPDTGKWDPERNTREFLAAMPEWRRHGLLSFTINLQGGSPQGYSKEQPWENNAFREDGSLQAEYLGRLERILDKADELGMAPIVGFFYFGQDERLRDEAAIQKGVVAAGRWLLDKGWRNVMVEIANECDNRSYQQASLQAARIDQFLRLCQSFRKDGRRLLVGASFNGGSVPSANVVKASDFILMHGNGVKDPHRIAEMVAQVRKVDGYRPMPVLFNEDDHFDFDKPLNNMVAAVESYASWGYFDPGESNYRDGYQCPPVNWGINTERKRAFFALLKEMTGGA